jgi:ribosome biogenesis GTPase / thiamine phosphate phosphatase
MITCDFSFYPIEKDRTKKINTNNNQELHVMNVDRESLAKLQNDELTVLAELGWNASLTAAFGELNQPELTPARVTGKTRNSFQVRGKFGEGTAIVAGGAYYQGMQDSLYPAVGDWVALRIDSAGQNYGIEAVLPRKSKITRQVSGGRDRYSGGATAEQVIAANVDIVFITASLDGSRNLNASKIERYLILTRASAASPVIILNKADLCPDVERQIDVVKQVAPSVPVLAISATRATGLERLQPYLIKGNTAVFLGPSGVGKSSIINALLGVERLKVGAVREADSKGRHTTIGQDLIPLPGGGNVIDTPGMREIQLWVDEEDLAGVFPDIEVLAEGCRFRDCTHRAEPGCAVKQAIDEGLLDARRLQNYRKLEREVRHLEARKNDFASVVEKKKWKKISQWQKDYRKSNPE